MDMNLVVSSWERRRSLTKNFVRLVMVFSLTFIMAGKAVAQYGGGTSGGGGGTSGGGSGPYTPPKGGYSSATGAGIGAGAAAGATALFLALHYRGRVTGCVQPAEDGLRFLDEGKNKSYTLVPGDVYLKPGQRVELKGQKSKNDAGDQTFKAQKLLKDLGTCNAVSSASSNAAAGR